VILNYNDKPSHHESTITSGVFVLDVSASSATLESSEVSDAPWILAVYP
jgi:hypothetical protein